MDNIQYKMTKKAFQTMGADDLESMIALARKSGKLSSRSWSLMFLLVIGLVLTVVGVVFPIISIMGIFMVITSAVMIRHKKKAAKGMKEFEERVKQDPDFS